MMLQGQALSYYCTEIVTGVKSFIVRATNPIDILDWVLFNLKSVLELNSINYSTPVKSVVS